MRKLFLILGAFLFAIQLHSSPQAQRLELAGQVELGKSQYEVSLIVEFNKELAHTIQYKGTAELTAEGQTEERPVSLYLTKSQKPRAIINILLDGVAKTEGLYLELVAENTTTSLVAGDVLKSDAEVMWQIRSPYRDFTETSYITRDRGQSVLEVLESR